VLVVLLRVLGDGRKLGLSSPALRETLLLYLVAVGIGASAANSARIVGANSARIGENDIDLAFWPLRVGASETGHHHSRQEDHQLRQGD
jgi:hypothetical protein